MRNGNELDIERADLGTLSLRDDADWDLRRSRLAQLLDVQQAGGKAGCVDRRPKAVPQVDDSTDMVFVRVGNDDADKIVPHLLDEGRVRHDDVDASLLRPRKGNAAVDHQPLFLTGGPETVEPHVHADLAQAAKRHENQLLRNLIHPMIAFRVSILALESACILVLTPARRVVLVGTPHGA